MSKRKKSSSSAQTAFHSRLIKHSHEHSHELVHTDTRTHKWSQICIWRFIMPTARWFKIKPQMVSVRDEKEENGWETMEPCTWNIRHEENHQVLKSHVLYFQSWNAWETELDFHRATLGVQRLTQMRASPYPWLWSPASSFRCLEMMSKSILKHCMWLLP